MDAPDALDFFAAGLGGPAGLDSVSRRGHAQMASSCSLPAKCEPGELAALEKAGVVFGEVQPGNRLFRSATLPDGWKIVPTSHHMYSDLLDEKGRRRAQIMYTAQDRDAWISARRRFRASAANSDENDWDSPPLPVIEDGSGKELWRGVPGDALGPCSTCFSSRAAVALEATKAGVLRRVGVCVRHADSAGSGLRAAGWRVRRIWRTTTVVPKDEWDIPKPRDLALRAASLLLESLAPDSGRWDAYWGEDGDGIRWPAHETPPDERATYVLFVSLHRDGMHVDSGENKSLRASGDGEAVKALMAHARRGFAHYDEVEVSIRCGGRVVKTDRIRNRRKQPVRSTRPCEDYYDKFGGHGRHDGRYLPDDPRWRRSGDEE